MNSSMCEKRYRKREQGIRTQILTERKRKAEDTTQSADNIRWQEHESLVFNIPV